MVLSENYNTLFLRIPKNASTSLATFFVDNCCTPNDKWTGIGDANVTTNNIDNSIVQKYRKQYRFIHLTLQEIVDNQIISKEKALGLDVIGVIRNPLERQLSLFFFKQRNSYDKSPITFRNMLKDGVMCEDGSNHIRQTDYLKLDGKHQGTWWLYDRLDEHLSEYVSSNNIIVKKELNTFKSKYTIDRRDKLIDEYYDDDTRKDVLKYYKEDYDIWQKLIER